MPTAKQPDPVNYLVTSRRYADAEYGETVSLVPTGAVLALVEGGHLKPVQERPSVAAKSKE
jgi:hypothetical protein